MIILTPNPDYKFNARDTSNGGSDELVIKETWVENVYQIEAGDFNIDDDDKEKVFVDIGANIGAVSVYVASLHKDIKVYAYEPEHNNHELLIQNTRENRVNHQVSVFKQAVSNYKGFIGIFCKLVL